MWYHLLVHHCTVTHELWAFIFAMFRVQWVMPQRMIDVIFVSIVDVVE